MMDHANESKQGKCPICGQTFFYIPGFERNTCRRRKCKSKYKVNAWAMAQNKATMAKVRDVVVPGEEVKP